MSTHWLESVSLNLFAHCLFMNGDRVFVSCQEEVKEFAVFLASVNGLEILWTNA